ncbi:MAG: PEGA domain-containing protein [Ignavibacteria bacterium]
MNSNIFLLIIVFIFLLHPHEGKAQKNDSLLIRYNYINSVPQNAAVYINDSLAGHTPLRFITKLNQGLKAGRLIKTKLEGYKDYIYTVQSSDSIINKTFFLSPLRRLKQREELVAENKGSFFKKKRKVIPIVIVSGITAGSAIMSYYFKTLANDKYSEYLNTGDPALLDKTKKYDLYSGISLGVFQIGIVSVIYFLFVD